MKKEIKKTEKCEHNAIAQGTGEKYPSCIDCGKEIKEPKKKVKKTEEWYKTLGEVILKMNDEIEELKILELLAQEKQNRQKELIKKIDELIKEEKAGCQCLACQNNVAKYYKVLELLKGK